MFQQTTSLHRTAGIVKENNFSKYNTQHLPSVPGSHMNNLKVNCTLTLVAASSVREGAAEPDKNMRFVSVGLDKKKLIAFCILKNFECN